MSTERERLWKRFLEQRGVRDPCAKCGGLGTHLYSSTSTWRGGMGGASMTTGVCDECWGSGDKNRAGANLRKLEHEQRQRSEAEVVEYMRRNHGWVVKRMRGLIKMLADYADKQSRKRKLPEGVHAFWWAQDWSVLAIQLRRLADYGDKTWEDEERERLRKREAGKR